MQASEKIATFDFDGCFVKIDVCKFVPLTKIVYVIWNLHLWLKSEIAKGLHVISIHVCNCITTKVVRVLLNKCWWRFYCFHCGWELIQLSMWVGFVLDVFEYILFFFWLVIIWAHAWSLLFPSILEKFPKIWTNMTYIPFFLKQFIVTSRIKHVEPKLSNR